ncbi:ABC transporter permease [Pseudonocardia kongjuensis]|uniref:ABC transporter permease n=1 Tax=Pseudonocardia kongjuensis TaxID=102227 RepID=A0ABN1XJ46_9PSEU
MIRAGRLTGTVALGLAAILAFPTVVVIGTSVTSGELLSFPPDGFSLRWYEDVLTDRRLVAAFRNSFVVGVSAAMVAMVVGTVLAVAAARGHGVPRGLVTGLALTPLVVPLVVAALGIYVVYVRLGLTGNATGMALAHATLGVPYVFINVLAALTGMNRNVEDAARAAGAGHWSVLLRITVPIVAPSAVIGGVLAFISSWEEVIVALFLVTPGFRTVPVVMWGEIQEGVSPATSAVASLVTFISILASLSLAVVPWMRRRVRHVVTKIGARHDANRRAAG